MLNTIEQKLSAIKAINEKIAEIDSACNHLSLAQVINWTLLSEDKKTDILTLARASYDATKAELLAKASDLMK
jgi:hypothetical protein